MRTLVVLAALSVGLSSSDSSDAIGLDQISQQSALGEPLRLVIRVLGDATEAATRTSFPAALG